MVVVKKAAGATSAPDKVKKPAVTFAPSVVSLPSEKSIPSHTFTDYISLIYGERKVGKTTLASQYPDALFLMFEPGGKGLEIYQTPVTSWVEFKAYIQALKTDTKFRTIVIDTVAAAYDRCFEYMLKKLAIDHPQDENDFGKAWGQIRQEFTNTLEELMSIGKGVVYIGHAEEKEVKTRQGPSYTRVVPIMARQAYTFLTAIVDYWFYYGYRGAERVLVVRGNDFIEAGCRPEKHFFTPQGQIIESVPMGHSSTEAYANLIKAFRNEQEDPGSNDLAPANTQPIRRTK